MNDPARVLMGLVWLAAAVATPVVAAITHGRTVRRGEQSEISRARVTAMTICSLVGVVCLAPFAQSLGTVVGF